MRIDLRSLTLDELQNEMSTIGEAKYRATQIYRWLHARFANTFDEMSDLSVQLRKKLTDNYSIGRVTQVKKLVSNVDKTTKYLFALNNDCIIESVFMQYSYGNTVCISTQAGCRMGCTFCASTLDGVEKNLTPAEMLSQIYEIEKDKGETVSGVVLMGSGEPLDNYENVVKFIKIINSKDGKNIGQRHITLSTCGLIEKIYDLSEENLQITLAVSLHAPNDTIRNKLMPVSKANPMDKLLEACNFYANKTKRRITFEYSLIKGVNDSAENAKELAGKLKTMLCHVNLIPVNEVKERNYTRSTAEAVKRFEDILTSRGIETTVRRKLGSDIDAACGQLRKRYKDENNF
ncbi:MAG: 23S rRNA (adenine(2503)-C(2))-methyltransferase RlmN [Candidatus Metalachnospira sp.]|nr:23S rRNA (adenine(2503)-C(2))-methyltransferase RlmN [Candidatus Metalachnospira sp.]